MRRRKPHRRVLCSVGVEAPSRTYFQGELMTCHLCGRQQQSDPQRESHWRVLEADGRPYYFCPTHFPPDGAGSEAYRIAYEHCLLSIVRRPQTSNPEASA